MPTLWDQITTRGEQIRQRIAEDERAKAAAKRAFEVLGPFNKPAVMAPLIAGGAVRQGVDSYLDPMIENPELARERLNQQLGPVAASPGVSLPAAVAATLSMS